ncbi:hypothetical protein V6M29_12060 [Stutzerimonas chloritidismutans]|uniref:N-acetyltransferase n=1 Tax=Stutzerimonas stutzeri subgroup TaxID=578833 RepID=UPI0009BB64CA
MIHPTAIVSPTAEIGPGVSIGAFSIIHDKVRIDAGTRIESHCEIGYPTPLAEGRELSIGENSLIRSHSVFYQGSVFGERLVTGHRVTVREKTEAGRNLQIGTLSDLQGHCQIGDFVRLHSNVHIGQCSRIGSYVWIFPYVVLTNDPHPPSNILVGVTVEEFAVIATMSVILPGVMLGTGSLVAAHSSVNRDVEPDTVVGGSPAKFLCRTEQVKLKDGSNQPAYPWRRHFHRGYPEDLVKSWVAMFS